MSLREIVQWPDPRLSRICAPVGEVTDEVRTLAADMLETMYAAPGRGLAGPQVGAMRRIFVMDATWKEGTPDPMVCVDPAILSASGETIVAGEGCLSIPGVTVDVERPVAVRLAWTSLDGRRQEAELEGFAALCVQHEVDHLNGVVTLDRLSPEVRTQVLAACDETRA